MLKNLSIPPGRKQVLFLDYLNSALRRKILNYSGQTQYLEDETFESSIVGLFSSDNSQETLTWKIRKDKKGNLKEIEVKCDGPNVDESIWEKDVQRFLEEVLLSAFQEHDQSFFIRRIFFYIGPQLDGEYWFNDVSPFRFAPILQDELPFAINVERAVSIDFNINAIDQNHANSLAEEAVNRIVAKLGFLLNVGIYSLRSENRWVINPATFECHRYPLGFHMVGMQINEMPKKGKLFKSGNYSGTFGLQWAGQFLSFPKETRKILRFLNKEKTQLAERFDQSVRLYRIASLIFNISPSATLAYRVASIEALIQGNSKYKSFSDFMLKNVPPREDLKDILDYLYQNIRSAHFHGGQFPMGEYESTRYFNPFIDQEFVNRVSIQNVCLEITRKAIVNWLLTAIGSGIQLSGGGTGVLSSETSA